MAEIMPDRVYAFIAGTGPVTRFWHRKYEVLHGYYRFATARGHVDCSPLPKIIPKAPEFVPHIFSHDELQRLLDASAYCGGSSTPLGQQFKITNLLKGNAFMFGCTVKLKRPYAQDGSVLKRGEGDNPLGPLRILR